MMSSWMSAQAWISSIAAPARSASAGSAVSPGAACRPDSDMPQHHPAYSSVGRIRLPPFMVNSRSIVAESPTTGSMAATWGIARPKKSSSTLPTAAGTSLRPAGASTGQPDVRTSRLSGWGMPEVHSGGRSGPFRMMCR